MNRRQTLKITIASIIALAVWCVPFDLFTHFGITLVEQRMIGVFLFAVIMWTTEAIPMWTTSVLVIGIMLIGVSDSSLYILREDYDRNILGTLVSYRNILTSFADPVIMMFLGGMCLSAAATSCGLDVQIAKAMLRPFGTKPETVLLGFMSATALFSMFMNNTATACIFLAIVAPIVRQLPNKSNERVAYILGIAFSASIGGLGTPIGTPPNAIAMKFLNEIHDSQYPIGFGEWMFFMIPLVVVLIVSTWLLLLHMFPFKRKVIALNTDIHEYTKSQENARNARKYVIITLTFLLTVILWATDAITGLNANIIGFIPICVFCVTGIFGKEELRKINWDILWLVAGGFALGTGMFESGLALHIASALNFQGWNPILMVLGSGLVCYAFSTFISNSATAALFLPILATVARSSEALHDYGAEPALIIGLAIASSLAMTLPVSTPPNAMAYNTGYVTQNQMIKAGLIVGGIGLLVAWLLLFYLGAVGML